MLDQRQADAQPTGRPICRRWPLHERLEDAVAPFGCDARPRIGDLDDSLARGGAHHHADGRVRRRILQGIDREVVDDLLQPHRVAPDPDLVGAHLPSMAAAALGDLQRLDATAHAARQLERMRRGQRDLARAHAADIEQVVDDPPDVAVLALDDAKEALLNRRVEGAAREHVGGARHGRHRVAQLVAEQRQKPVFGDVFLLRCVARQAFVFEQLFALLFDTAACALLLRQQVGGVAQRTVQGIDLEHRRSGCVGRLAAAQRAGRFAGGIDGAQQHPAQQGGAQQRHREGRRHARRQPHDSLRRSGFDGGHRCRHCNRPAGQRRVAERVVGVDAFQRRMANQPVRGSGGSGHQFRPRAAADELGSAVAAPDELAGAVDDGDDPFRAPLGFDRELFPVVDRERLGNDETAHRRCSRRGVDRRQQRAAARADDQIGRHRAPRLQHFGHAGLRCRWRCRWRQQRSVRQARVEPLGAGRVEHQSPNIGVLIGGRCLVVKRREVAGLQVLRLSERAERSE